MIDLYNNLKNKFDKIIEKNNLLNESKTNICININIKPYESNSNITNVFTETDSKPSTSLGKSKFSFLFFIPNSVWNYKFMFYLIWLIILNQVTYIFDLLDYTKKFKHILLRVFINFKKTVFN